MPNAASYTVPDNPRRSRWPLDRSRSVSYRLNPSSPGPGAATAGASYLLGVVRPCRSAAGTSSGCPATPTSWDDAAISRRHLNAIG